MYKYLLVAFFLIACGDKEEDTGEATEETDSGSEDTGE
jgi:hypothetical protein